MNAPNLDAKGAPEASQLDKEGLFETIKEWVTADIEFSNAWRVRAKKEFAFVAGPGQWDERDSARLQEEERPVVTFNKTSKFIRAICGIEANNRMETVYLPSDVTDEGEVKANELLSNASDWMDRGCKANRQQSRGFRDTAICGMGWTEGVIDYDEDARGKYVETRCDPLEMGWDKNARDLNLQDSKRRWRVRKMTLKEARELIPGVTDAPGIMDADLDATWAADVSSPKDGAAKSQEQKELREEATAAGSAKKEVHIVQIQWWEFEPYIKTIDLLTQKEIDVTEAQYALLNDQAQPMIGQPLPMARLRRKVFKQAFVGGKVLQVGPSPRKDGFTFNCITWEPDESDGTWYGIVRLLWDPQTWANKFFAQLMHIVNSTAKGGIIAEKDAIDGDAALFLKNYAKPNAVSIVANGAIAKGKIMAKPGAALTGGVAALLEVTDQAFSDVSGINLELMGLADRDQPGVLEAQRKQAAMTILATLFDSFASFRQDVGLMRLYFIQNYLADDRLIRVHGDDGMKAIPLIKDRVLGKFDVIVDDAPSSPNSKEKAWAGLQMILPAFKEMLTPKVAAILIDYVPHIPSKLAEGLKALALGPGDPAEQAQAQIAAQGQQAQIDKDKATADKQRASATLDLAKAAEVKAAVDMGKLQAFLSMVGLMGSGQKTVSDEPIMGPRLDGPRPPPQLQELPPMAQTGGGVEPMQPMPNGVIPPGGLQ